jgi:hypothetical protein
MKAIAGLLWAALAAAFFIASPASAADLQITAITTCGTLPSSQGTLVPGGQGLLFIDTTGKLCVAATVTATATTTGTAASALPTISAGAGAAMYESLAGAQYSQPVFGSASGGGTQVDATHGLPTDVKASVLPPGAATAALQGTNTATTAHTCSTGGYSEIGCLGQIDDDVKGPVGAGTNLIGTVGGQTYFTIAASQTAQVLGATGAAGDYLGFCTIYPTSTSPGVLTVFDSTSSAANNAIAFPGGASSLSNLTPINIPVGAISKNGAWKVTTGANMVVTCNGRFT